MKCPRCRNRGFQSTPDVRKPIKNIGGKEHYDNFNLRRYICMQCGYAFITKEEFYREIQISQKRGA